jgi:hypothetical protein
LGFCGRPWTFDNNQSGDKNVKVRLDLAVASPSRSEWFPNSSVQHIVSSRSDHCPILLSIEADDNRSAPRQLARYEVMWERELSLSEESRGAWSSCSTMFNLEDVATSLRKIMSKLKVWSHNKFRAVSKELEKIQKQMEQLELQHPHTNQVELMSLRNRMDELFYREEMIWLQYSRIS